MNKAYLKQILWDIPESELGNVDEQIVISRGLTVGTLPIVQNIFNVFGKSKVNNVFKGMKATAMPTRRYKYFKNIFDNIKYRSYKEVHMYIVNKKRLCYYLYRINTEEDNK